MITNRRFIGLFFGNGIDSVEKDIIYIDFFTMTARITNQHIHRKNGRI